MTSMFNTPDSPAKSPVGYTTQGGNFWTLITPEIWKVLHAVVGTPIAFGLQAFKEALGSAALCFGEVALRGQPAFQYGSEITQLGRWLMLTKIDRFALGLQVFAHRRTG